MFNYTKNGFYTNKREKKLTFIACYMISLSRFKFMNEILVNYLKRFVFRNRWSNTRNTSNEKYFLK